MKKIFLTGFLLASVLFSVHAQTLVFHTIVTDTSGKMIPWYNPDPGISYDHDLQLIWNFWNNIPSNGGTKNYMTDHSYSFAPSGNMVGGDQFAMAMSSWALYYAYTGDPALITNMRYIADTYLANSLSSGSAAWPNIPYPCNAGFPSLPAYDGDYILGTGYTQPDKAGSFGNELVTLYKITGDTNYLRPAINIANTLAAKVQPGDSATSPFPFKVNAQTGALPIVLPGSLYTANVVPTLRLFRNLIAMGTGNTVQYDSAYNTIRTWVQNYPEKTNNWGCFFEDIPVYSNTETNAVTMAHYILEHPNWSGTPLQDARNILDWTFTTFADTVWSSYGATAIFEQSSDLKPGGSHTSRYASVELLYSEITGDTTLVDRAIRELNWATYLVDTSGQCRFSPSETSVWYTDGYGDYVRHYMTAMAAYPQIAPYNANHLLGTTSVVTNINYQPLEITYTTFDSTALDVLRLTSKPVQVKANGNLLTENSNLSTEGWVWTPYAQGGVLRVRHDNSRAMDILWNPSAVNELAVNENFMQVFPNPAQGSVMVNYTLGKEQAVTINVVDVTGKKVQELNMVAHAFVNTAEINIAGLQPGIYFVSLTAEGVQMVRKLVVAK